MSRRLRTAVPCLVAAVLAGCPPVVAQTPKPGGTLRMYNTTNPPSASLHVETTIASVMSFSAIYNNLVRFDPAKPRNSSETIIPDLSESWHWDET